MSGGRRSLLAVIGIFLALSGTTLIAVAMTTQEPPPQPTVAAAGALDPLPMSPSNGPTAQDVETVLSRSKPVVLDIPSIGVRSSLLSLGLNADGTVQVPSGTSYDEAGWYRFSPTPGSLGPAVILGHVSGAGHASVFFRLGDLRPGNRVRVTPGRIDRGVRGHGCSALPEGSFPDPARVRQHEPRGAPADHVRRILRLLDGPLPRQRRRVRHPRRSRLGTTAAGDSTDVIGTGCRLRIPTTLGSVPLQA